MWDAQGMTENEPKEQQVTRETLYELVWAKPIRTVAAEIGISDVGLAKACDRLNIPRPAVGHWVRLEHGRKTERPPLPPAAPGQETMLAIKPLSPGAARSKEPGAPKPEPPVVAVEDNLRKPHPAVRQLQQILRDRTPDKYGILVSPLDEHPQMPASIDLWRPSVGMIRVPGRDHCGPRKRWPILPLPQFRRSGLRTHRVANTGAREKRPLGCPQHTAWCYSSFASMRRFFWRPSSVLLGAMGRSSPKPTASSRFLSMPFDTM